MGKEIKIMLPENISDITLEQYQKFEKLKATGEDLDNRRYAEKLIAIFTDLKKQQIKKLIFKDYEFLVESIVAALSQEVVFQQRFEFEGVEYGMIPNLDEISMGEYADLKEYGSDIDNMHKVMAVLFRPVVKSDMYDNYDIEAYNGTKGRDLIMKRLPMNIVQGALVFFYNLASELETAILKYMEKAQERLKSNR